MRFLANLAQGTSDQFMNERVVPKMTNSHVVKLSNSPAITPHRELPVPRRQDVDERPCVPRLELDHFESQPDSPRIIQRFPSSPIGFGPTLGYTDEKLSFYEPRDNPLVLSS